MRKYLPYILILQVLINTLKDASYLDYCDSGYHRLTMAWALIYSFLLYGILGCVTTASPLDIVPTNIDDHGVNAADFQALEKRRDCYVTINLFRDIDCRGTAVSRTTVTWGTQFDLNTCTRFTVGQDAFRSYSVVGEQSDYSACSSQWLYLYYTNHCELSNGFAGGGGYIFVGNGGCTTPKGDWFASARLIRHEYVVPPDKDPRG